MSFKRKGPGPLASGVIGAVTGLAIVGGVLVLLAIPASANTQTQARERMQTQAANTAG